MYAQKVFLLVDLLWRYHLHLRIGYRRFYDNLSAMVDASSVGRVDDADDDDDADGSDVCKTVEASSTGKVDDENDGDDADGSVVCGIVEGFFVGRVHDDYDADADGSIVCGIVEGSSNGRVDDDEDCNAKNNSIAWHFWAANAVSAFFFLFLKWVLLLVPAPRTFMFQPVGRQLRSLATTSSSSSSPISWKSPSMS